VLSIYFVIQTVGAAAGQGLAGLDETSGAMTFGLSSILVSLSLLPLMISRNRAPDYSAPDRFSMIQLARISPMAVSGAMLNGVAQAAFYVGMPLYGLARGMGAADSALLLVIGTLSGAAVQFPVGWVSDRVDRRLVVGGLSIACVAIGLGLASGSFGDHVYVAVALIGALTLPVYSICVAHANDQIAPNQIVPASGTLVLALNIGILFGAFAGPFAIGTAGPTGLPVLFTVISAVMTAIAFLRRVRAEAPENTRVAQPVAALGVQTTGVMHPEAEESPVHETP
jgi:predicted MFS family arabinose efflux permease